MSDSFPDLARVYLSFGDSTYPGKGHQVRTRIDTRVEATITHMQVEASALSSWWLVTAEWRDPNTSQVLTFRSHHLNFPPHHRIGEQIIVNVDATELKHYRMEL